MPRAIGVLFFVVVVGLIVAAAECAAHAQTVPGQSGDPCAISQCTFTVQCSEQPNSYGYIDCVGVEDCSAVCVSGLTCAIAGDDPNNPGGALWTCQGPVCGIGGDVVCSAGSLCDYGGDCIQACYGPDGAPIIDAACAQDGEIALPDGTCMVPATADLCSTLGGHPGP